MVKTFYPIQTSFSILGYFSQSTTFDYNSNQNDYIAEIYDNKMQKIKTIKYICSNLNEVKSFTTIQIYDEFIASGSHYDYITLAQQKTSVSKMLFNPIYINELIKLLDTL